MLHRTGEGMSIRLVASGSPICKKYDYETKNILKQMDIKLASYKIINADRKLTTIDDQRTAIKRINNNKKLITHFYGQTSL